MALLQVRNFPDNLYEELKQRAAQENRSVAQQTTAFLRDSLAPKASETSMPHAAKPLSPTTPESNIERRKRVLEEIHQFHLDHPGMFDGWPDGATLIREEREELDRRADNMARLSWTEGKE